MNFLRKKMFSIKNNKQDLLLEALDNIEMYINDDLNKINIKDNTYRKKSFDYEQNNKNF